MTRLISLPFGQIIISDIKPTYDRIGWWARPKKRKSRQRFLKTKFVGEKRVNIRNLKA